MSKVFNNYQYVEVKNKIVNLKEHTLDKYNVATEVIKECKTVLDAGCSIGGIGLKLSQESHVESVTLNNITKNELNTAKEIGSLIESKNVKYSDENIFELKDTFDLTMYFALVHHLLRVKSFDEIMEFIKKQTNKYTILEIPIKGDALLDNVIKASQITDAWTATSGRFYPLTSCGTLFTSLSKHFEIVSVQKMHYGSGNLARYAFVCKIKKAN